MHKAATMRASLVRARRLDQQGTTDAYACAATLLCDELFYHIMDFLAP